MYLSPYLGIGCWEGGSPKGLVDNLLMQFCTLDSSKIEVSKPIFLICWPHKITCNPCKACFRQHFCVFHFIWVLGTRRGGSPKGLVHNVLIQFFTLGGSKIEVSKIYVFDMLATQNNMQPM